MKTQIEFYERKLNFEMDSADLFEGLQEGSKLIVIDARKLNAFQTEHIPTSINLPHKEMNPSSTNELSKEATYVIYCDGIGCNASTKGALNMAKLGFKVKELLGGLDWWKRDGYATEGNNATAGNKVECSC